MKQLHEFTSVDWIALYRKTKMKRRIGVIGEMLEAVGNCIVSMRGSKDVTPFVRAVDVVAQKMACQCDLVAGWKLHGNWFRQLFAQLVNHENVACLYFELGWDFNECSKFTFSRTTTLHTFKRYNHVLNKTETFNLLLVSSVAVPDGSVWKSSTGKMWEVQEIERGGIVLMASETPDKTGKFKTRRFPISVVETWKRVREVE